MSTAVKSRTHFMETWFHELPQELQNLIVSKAYRVPKPRFHKNSFVTYTQEYKQKLNERINELRQHYGGYVGARPTGLLRIYQQPSFNWKRFEWSYAYEYGLWGTSEGYAIESDLEPG